MTPLPSQRHESYRLDIDGLRAVAILPVLCYHAGLGFPGGFVGVDVFFVISGFLITNVIQNEIHRGTFSIVTFWERRVRRLFPALALVVVATLAAGYFLLLPADFRELGQSAVAQALLSANFYFWRESDYFAAPSEIKPLLHLWSLAVEEQFYLLLPPFLMIRWRPLVRLWALGTLLVASIGWSVYSSWQYPSASFYLLPSRAWELLIGVLLAQFYDRVSLSRPVAELTGLVGIALIAASCFAYNSATIFPGLAAIPPCIGAAAIIASGGRTPATLVQRLLSSGPCVMLGLLSYSLYLWHWPVFAYASYLKFEPLSVPVRLALVGISVVAAAFSLAIVEQPVRRRAVCKSRRSIFVTVGIGTSALLAVGMLIHFQGGMRSRFPQSVLRAADARNDRNPQRRLRHDLSAKALRAGMPRLGDLDDRRPPVLAVIGDSHADALMPVLDSMCREFRIPAVAATQSATIPLFCEQSEPRPHKREFQTTIRQQLESGESIRHVLLVARWSHHPSQVMNRENLRRTVDALVDHGKTVWLFRQVPEQKTNIPRALALSTLWNRDLSPAICTSQEYLQERTGADSFLAEMTGDGIFVLDPIDVFFVGTESCRVTRDGLPFYVDDDHLSVFGAMQLRSVLLPMFEAILSDR
jgi:peptidoglycan/LPS O-acetylase OafA/YrhL